MDKISPDLSKVLASRVVAAAWDTLTPIARRDFISWIESAKRPETRKKRIESIPERLASGKRRPCCYAIVPMDLYKALDEVPKAKTTWKSLTPDARRDFTDWIDQAKDSSVKTQRIDKACSLLAAGKRHP